MFSKKQITANIYRQTQETSNQSKQGYCLVVNQDNTFDVFIFRQPYLCSVLPYSLILDDPQVIQNLPETPISDISWEQAKQINMHIKFTTEEALFSRIKNEQKTICFKARQFFG